MVEGVLSGEWVTGARARRIIINSIGCKLPLRLGIKVEDRMDDLKLKK